jgi:hypothetical protein
VEPRREAQGLGVARMTAAFPIRIHAVRLKRKSRYRSPSAFNLTTSKLLRASLGVTVKLSEKGMG